MSPTLQEEGEASANVPRLFEVLKISSGLCSLAGFRGRAVVSLGEPVPDRRSAKAGRSAEEVPRAIYHFTVSTSFIYGSV